VGWRHRVDVRLIGGLLARWDGFQPWDAIGAAAVDTWCRDFAQHRPGGGETLVWCTGWRVASAFIADAHGDPYCRIIFASRWNGPRGLISAARWLQ
jgi:alpha-ribazole phosphatase